jgi:methylmalonyl-CoA carboxyltransferase large subunit
MATKSKSSELEILIRDIRAELAALAERVARLEPAAAPAVAAPATEVAREAAPREEAAAVPVAPAGPAPIGDEELLAISAALAAYFGVRVHVRQIRLITSSAWAQQGRVSIQASHRLF